MRVTALRLASISPTWQDWTPVWTTSTGAGAPSFGDASVTARWAQAARTVFWRLEITFGATTNFGGGGSADNWRMTAPVTAAGTALVCGQGEIQAGNTPSGYPNVAGTRQGLRVRLTTATHLEFEMSTGNIGSINSSSGAGLIDAVTPWPWTAGAALRAWGQYESAT
ncbi:hypothetical protein DKG34_10940 [Streptomyces sp. NWU49]|nr:hypothetical protein DKG34_10940 [Streptomyces sp. NWU49]